MEKNGVPADLLSDLEAVLCGKLDPELLRRVEERAAVARAAVFERSGIQEISAGIRALRDGEEE